MYGNSAHIIGRLVADVAFTDHADATKKRSWLRIAVNRPGSKHCDFIPVVCWGDLAVAVATHCKKGKEVAVDGSLNTYSKPRDVDAEGKATSYDNYFEIVARNVSFGRDAQDKNTAAPAATMSSELQGLMGNPELLGAAIEVLRRVQEAKTQKSAPTAAQGATDTADPFPV
jgi:single-stranded DNA-binding protein